MKEITYINGIKGKEELLCLLRVSLCIMLAGISVQRVDARDTARFIRRNCPIKRVDTEEEYQQAVQDGPEWKGGKVRVIGECTFDARAIKSWAEAHGIKCNIASTVAYYGRRKIPNGHWTVVPEGSKYTLDYVENVGVVSRRIRAADELVFLKKGAIDRRISASVSLVRLPGKMKPVRSINFSVIPKAAM